MSRRASLNSLAACAAAALFCTISAAPVAADAPRLPAQGSLQALFAPWDDIEAAVMDAIEGARRQILVQSYLLTSKKIATTLVAAHRRGVEVHVLLDAAQLERVQSPVVAELADAGIEVWLETRYQNAHNKVMVIDAALPEATIITGSFNFTWTAQHKNAENILIVRNNPALADRYARNWERHRQDATSYRK